jgi:hypothetical protein
MEYFLIIVLQILGVAFHIMQKVIKLGDDNPEMPRRQIFSVFFREDWDTLTVSGLILILHLVVHYAIDRYTPDFRATINYYVLYAFAAAFMLGYLGQRAVYRWLGSAEKKIDAIVDIKTR